LNLFIPGSRGYWTFPVTVASTVQNMLMERKGFVEKPVETYAHAVLEGIKSHRDDNEDGTNVD